MLPQLALCLATWSTPHGHLKLVSLSFCSLVLLKSSKSLRISALLPITCDRSPTPTGLSNQTNKPTNQQLQGAHWLTCLRRLVLGGAQVMSSGVCLFISCLPLCKAPGSASECWPLSLLPLLTLFPIIGNLASCCVSLNLDLGLAAFRTVSDNNLLFNFPVCGTHYSSPSDPCSWVLNLHPSARVLLC